MENILLEWNRVTWEREIQLRVERDGIGAAGLGTPVRLWNMDIGVAC